MCCPCLSSGGACFSLLAVRDVRIPFKRWFFFTSEHFDTLLHLPVTGGQSLWQSRPQVGVFSTKKPFQSPSNMITVQLKPVQNQITVCLVSKHLKYFVILCDFTEELRLTRVPLALISTHSAPQRENPGAAPSSRTSRRFVSGSTPNSLSEKCIFLVYLKGGVDGGVV